MGRKKKGIPGVSFSWKRATGISAAKSKISRKTGIPLTKAGRQRKVGKMAGCCVPIALFFVLVIAACTAFAHPGNVDANGRHRNSQTGEYHYHPERIKSSGSPTGKRPLSSLGATTRSTPAITAPRVSAQKDPASAPNSEQLAPGWVGSRDKPTIEEARLGSYRGGYQLKRQVEYGDPVAKGGWAEVSEEEPKVEERSKRAVKPNPEHRVYTVERTREFHWQNSCPMIGESPSEEATLADAKESRFIQCGVCRMERPKAPVSDAPMRDFSEQKNKHSERD